MADRREVHDGMSEVPESPNARWRRELFGALDHIHRLEQPDKDPELAEQVNYGIRRLLSGSFPPKRYAGRVYYREFRTDMNYAEVAKLLAELFLSMLPEEIDLPPWITERPRGGRKHFVRHDIIPGKYLPQDISIVIETYGLNGQPRPIEELAKAFSTSVGTIKLNERSIRSRIGQSQELQQAVLQYPRKF